MLRGALWLAAALAAVWAHRSRWTQRPASVRVLLAGFASVFLAWRGLDLAVTSGRLALGPAARLGLEAALALALWTATVGLLSYERRTRDRVVRGILLGLAFLLGGPELAIVLTATVLTTFRWRATFTTRGLLLLALAAALLLATALLRAPAPETAPGSALRTLADFERWSYDSALIFAGYGLIALLAGVVRDPTLGIRRVGRRLALSHVLVVGVPVVLVAMLWVATTVLGVSAERALVASRALATEGELMERGLWAGLDAADPPRTLARWADTQVARWPRCYLWSVRDGAWIRVRGDSLRDERRLRVWVDSLAFLPTVAFVTLGDSLYYGAVARVSSPARAALVLAPASTFVAGMPERIAGARLLMHRAPVTATRRTVNIGTHDDDSTGRDSSAASGPHVTLNNGGERYSAVTPGTPVMAELIGGHALLPGLKWNGTGWSKTSYLLTAIVSPGSVLTGLRASTHDNPIGMLPLIFIAALAIVFGLVAAFDLVMVTRMGHSITSAIGALRAGAGRLEAGDLAHRIDIPATGDDELWDVAGAFNTAAEGLERGRAAERERERLESELSVAREIHRRLLPETAPAVPGLELAGLSESAREVGGDYYDHIDLGNGRALLVIADVSGKGVPAALLMSGFRASLMSQELAGDDVAAVVQRLNEFVVRSVRPGKFITAFVAIADVPAARLRYVNAGHNPPVLRRANGATEWLDVGGPILGIAAGVRYPQGDLAFLPGDLLLLYTDGVTEGASVTRELWGDERLLVCVTRRAAEPCAELVRHVAEEVRAHEGEAGPADDVTLLAARVRPR